MSHWKREPFETFISEGHFRVKDAGPLHVPILSFSIKRNEKLEIILKTIGDEKTENNAVLRRAGVHPAGTVRINTDKVELQSLGGSTVSLVGVQPLSETSFSDYETRTRRLEEEAKVHRVDTIILPPDQAAHTIDWLENVDGRYYHWPNLIINETETIHTRTFGREADAIKLTDRDESYSSGHAAIHLTVSGIEFYLCNSSHDKRDGQISPGYILYIGTPNEDLRRKIRTILSFALGFYAVYLGCATYSSDWKLASFSAVSAYSMDKKAFELPTMPPAFLGTRGHNELSHGPVSKLVSALFTHYDDLQFGALSWAYWHARCAPLHIAAVHFGAAIEALQRRYLAVHSADFSTKIVSTKWDDFARAIISTIDASAASNEIKEILKRNVGLLNQVPRSVLTDRILDRVGLELGSDERKAWKRRHDAAHGNDIAPGSEPDMIRDTKLLKVLFHRMLLKIVNGSDLYYDYASLDFPLRKLREAVPPAA